eukprot:scaffold202326_cov21-Prasinocladus_malaysianus.AAC.1
MRFSFSSLPVQGTLPPELGNIQAKELVLNNNFLEPSARAYGDSKIILDVNNLHSTRAGWVS